MKKRTILILSLLCAAALPAWAANPAPLADRFPARTVAYLGWAGQTQAFDQSAFGKMLTSPMVQSLVDKLRETLVSQADGPEDAEAFDHLWAMADLAWRHPAAIGLIEMSPPEPATEEEPQPEVHVQAALLVDLGDAREEFDGHLQEVLASSDEPLQPIEVAGEPCHLLSTEAGPAVFGYIGDVFFFAVGEGTAEMLAGLSPADSLQADRQFTGAIAGVSSGVGATGAVGYARIDSIRSIVETFLPPAPSAEDDENGVRYPTLVDLGSEIFNSAGITWLWQAIGIDKATTFAAAVEFQDTMMRIRTHLATPAPHHGLLVLYSGRPLTDEDLAMVPADADYFSAFHLDPGAIYDQAMEVLQQMPAPSDQKHPYDVWTQETLPDLEEELGFRLKDDLLDSLGDRWILCSAPSYGGFLTGTVLIADVDNPAGIQTVMDQLEGMVGGVQVEGGPATTQPAPGGGPPIEISQTLAGSTPIHYVSRFLPGSSRPMPIPVAPAWAVQEDHLYAALFPQVIETVLTREDIVPITQDPQFQRMRGLLTLKDNVVSMEYVNSPKIVGQVYNVLLLVSTALQGMPEDQFPFPTDWLRLPSLTTLEENLSPEIGVLAVDAEGLSTEWCGTVPLSGIYALGTSTTAMTATILLPSLNRARDQAKRAVSMAKLNAIGMAVAMYMAENDDRPPNDFMDLIDEGMIQVDNLRSSNSPGTPPQIVDGRLVGEVGYVYLKPTPNMDGSLIMAYERPEYYRGQGTCVVCVDSSVQWMEMGEFMALLEQTQAARTQAGQ